MAIKSSEKAYLIRQIAKKKKKKKRPYPFTQESGGAPEEPNEGTP